MNKAIFAITWLVIVICTVCAYLLVFPFIGNLFFINVCTAVVAETVLLSTIPIMSSKSLLTFKNATLYMIARSYAILAFIWVTAFTVYHGIHVPAAQDGIAHHYAIVIGLLILTIIFVASFAFAYFSGTAMERINAQTEMQVALRKTVSIKTEDFQNAVSGVSLSDDPLWNADIEKKVNLIVNTIQTIPAAKVASAQQQIEKINNELGIVEQAFSDYASNQSNEQKARLQNTIERALNNIQHIKKTI